MSLYATKVVPTSTLVYAQLGGFWNERFADVAAAKAMVKAATDWSATEFRLIDQLSANIATRPAPAYHSLRSRFTKVGHGTPSAHILNPYPYPEKAPGAVWDDTPPPFTPPEYVARPGTADAHAELLIGGEVVTEGITSPVVGTADAHAELLIGGEVDAHASFTLEPVFEPSNLTGLQLWLDASDSSTLYDATTGGSLVAADGAVARWEDKSGNARHVTQATLGARPLRKAAAQNSKDVLRFDGDDVLGLTDTSILRSVGGYTCFVVVKPTDTAVPRLILQITTNNSETSARALVRYVTDAFRYAGRRLDGESAVIVDAGTVNVNWNLTGCVVDLSSGDASFNLNGVLTTSDAAFSSGVTSDTNSYLTVGGRFGLYGVSPQLIGDIAEALVYNRALDATERRQVEEYLQAKWATPALPEVPQQITGLQLWLDASDPDTLYDATTGGSLVAADGAVARWEDKSGNARHATQETLGARPLRKTAVQNGADVLRFDGSDDVLTLASGRDLAQNVGAVSILAAVKYGRSGSDRVFLASANFPTLARCNIGIYASNFACGGRRLDADSFQGITSVGTITSDYVLHGAVFNYQSATLDQYINGTLDGSSNAFQTSGLTEDRVSEAIAIGAAVSHQFLQGDIAEILIYNRALDATERRQVEEYLQAKWATPALP